MSNDIIERMRVARIFSNTGVKDFSDTDHSTIVDFASAVVQHRLDANVDRRVIAVGSDVDALDFEITSQATYEVIEHVWSSMAFQTMLESMLSKSLQTALASDSQKVQVLISAGSPFPFRQKMMADASYEVTWLNTSHLFNQETFFFSSAEALEYGDFSYSAIDVQDVFSGAVENTFHMASVHSNDIIDVDTNLLSKVMDSVKTGGFLIIRDATGYGQLYEDSLAVHRKIHSEIGNYVCSRADFQSYHVPIDSGSIVCVRTG